MCWAAEAGILSSRQSRWGHRQQQTGAGQPAGAPCSLTRAAKLVGASVGSRGMQFEAGESPLVRAARHPHSQP